MPIGVVLADAATDVGSCLAAALEGIEEDAFVFQRSLKQLDGTRRSIHNCKNIGAG
jgi:hypothetical protein